MKSEQINSYTEVKQRTERDVRQLGYMVSESYEADSTDGQTVINLNFSIDINNKKQIWVFVDGQKLVEGSTSNYIFTNVVGSISSQITLNAPLIAGLAIQVYKIGAYQEQLPNPSSVTATLLNDVAQPHKMAQDAFQPFVKKELITAPNTTIVNRAKVESGALKSIAGIERVHTRNIAILRDEFDVNGGPVYEAQNRDSRIRFVGNGWSTIVNTDGSRPMSSTVNDFLEITFYGTGLNILSWVGASPATVLASIDGGAEGANIYPSGSSVLAGRSYSTNQLLTIASNLSLGWHTAKLRITVAGSGLNVYGFEILNQRTDLAVLSGTAYFGAKQEMLNALSASAFNAGVVGSRGARVVKYIKDGIVSQAVTNVDGASAYLTSTDHSNEEVYRKINFKEFGANRSDDFSTMTGTASSRGYTLDDNVTTLSCTNYLLNNGPSAVDGIVSQGNTSITITFVGTGLDIIRTDNQNGTSQNNPVVIDGVSVGNLNVLSSVTQRREKICSGLPYGTHIVKITSAATYSFGVSDFIIYQPKKPTLPSGAIELADYCVLANFINVDTQDTNAPFKISQGVIRKYALREFVYTGSYLIDGFNTTVNTSGWQVYTQTTGTVASISFYGTGIVLTGRKEVGYKEVTLAVDGLSNFSSYTTQAFGWAFTPSTGLLATTGTAGKGSSVAISGLALGWHTLTMTTLATGTTFEWECVDIITPIHMNNFKVGSLSLKDSRAFSPIIDKPEKVDLGKAKAWCLYDQVNSTILDSYNISSCLQSATGQTYVYFEKQFKTKNYVVNTTANQWQCTSNAGQNNVFKNATLVSVSNESGTLINGIFSITCYGELEDEGEI